MKEIQLEARPDRELTSQRSNQSKHQEPAGRGQQRWYENPHEELVRSFRNYVQETVRATEGQFSPAEIIAAGLRLGHIGNSREEDLYSQLRLAWDALAFDYYTPGSIDDFRAGDTLHSQYRYAQVRSIRLTDPLQILAIDALTEAVGIPHQKGQAEITIPDKLRHYNQWIYSKENEERIAKAIAERSTRETKAVPRLTEPKRNTQES